MTSLTEIQAAVEALPPEQKEELLRFLTAQVRSTEHPRRGARLVRGPNGTVLLEAAPDSPPMTTEMVKKLLKDFP